MFSLTAAHLRILSAANEFPTDPTQRGDPGALVFAGIRGCLPIDPGDQSFAPSRDLQMVNVDHRHPRCTLVQWVPKTGLLAAYPGSTVPHRRYIERGFGRGGRGANQLLTGFFDDFRKGMHRPDSPTGHEAFRQTNSRPYRRTGNDLEYDTDDRVETENPGDNLHAGWCGGVDDERFSSAGCQVVVGYPACDQREGQPAVGPWRAFHDVAYARKRQTSFGYLLVNGFELQRLVVVGARGSERVRFGSNGPRARRVQKGLQRKGVYEGRIDGVFGPRSLRALLRFQESALGRGASDGVCGPQTATALGITWP